MPRTIEALLIEADEWRHVAAAMLTINDALGAIGDTATTASVDAVTAIATGNLAGVVDVQAAALAVVLERVLEAQRPLEVVVKATGDRLTTLRVEAAELRAELDQ